MKLVLILILNSVLGLAFEGQVIKKEFVLPSFKTVNGEIISPVKIGYENYGKLNADKSNVILVTHYFSGTSHAAGKYKETDLAPGYWDAIIGPGKALDTDKYFIISSDTLVNLTPYDPNTITTGPASINPKTKKKYGMSFPVVSVRDFVEVQRALLDSLDIKKLYAVVGASGGAAQAMEWAAAYPDDVAKVISVIGPGLALHPYTIALLNIWSAPIQLDPKWKGGKYEKNDQPLAGIAESLKLITWSCTSFEWAAELAKVSPPPLKSPLSSHEQLTAIEAAMNKRASDRAKNVDANSLLYMAKAMENFNMEEGAQKIKAEVLFVPAEKDLLFPPSLSESAAKKLCSLGKSAEVSVMKTDGGHLDGITKISEASKVMSQFLERKIGSGKGCK